MCSFSSKITDDICVNGSKADMGKLCPEFETYINRNFNHNAEAFWSNQREDDWVCKLHYDTSALNKIKW